MAIADPKTYAKKTDAEGVVPINNDTASLIAALIEGLKSLKGEDDDTLKKRAQYEAQAHALLNKRENETHPGISVYSYPEGDRARPKEPLACEMFWVGYPLDIDGLMPDEIALLNRAVALQAGRDSVDYTFMRTDGSPEKLTIVAKTDNLGAARSLQFGFPCRGENSNNLPSKAAMLRQAFGLPTVEQEEIARLRAELATASAR